MGCHKDVTPGPRQGGCGGLGHEGDPGSSWKQKSSSGNSCLLDRVRGDEQGAELWLQQQDDAPEAAG